MYVWVFCNNFWPCDTGWVKNLSLQEYFFVLKKSTATLSLKQGMFRSFNDHLQLRTNSQLIDWDMSCFKLKDVVHFLKVMSCLVSSRLFCLLSREATVSCWFDCDTYLSMQQCNATNSPQIQRVAVDYNDKLFYQFQVWDNDIILPTKGTQTKYKSRALTAKTTNFLMTDLDNFLKRPWIPTNEK